MISDDTRKAAEMLLAKSSQQLQMAHRDLEAARAEVERFEKVVAGLEALLEEQPGPPPPVPSSEAATTHHTRSVGERAGGSLDQATATVSRGSKTRSPRGSTAVREVVMQAGSQGITLPEVVEALKDRGWINPESTDPKGSTRVAFSRLRKEDPRFRNLDGRYTFVADFTPGSAP